MNTPIKFCLRFFNEPEILDSGPTAWSPSQRTCAEEFYVLEKFIDLSWVWTLDPWISRRARYPQTDIIIIIIITCRQASTHFLQQYVQIQDRRVLLNCRRKGKRPQGRPMKWKCFVDRAGSDFSIMQLPWRHVQRAVGYQQPEVSAVVCAARLLRVICPR